MVMADFQRYVLVLYLANCLCDKLKQFINIFSVKVDGEGRYFTARRDMKSLKA